MSRNWTGNGGKEGEVELGATSSKRVDLCGVGLGLKEAHLPEVLAALPDVDWFELLIDNYLGASDGLIRSLLTLRADCPLSFHGVGMSLGSTDSLDYAYLSRIKRLAEILEPALISEHLAWSSIDGEHLHSLLPVPFSKEALAHLALRIHAVQEYLGRSILVENVSSYILAPGSEFSEEDFLLELSANSGCGILLDLSNLYLNSVNHKFDPRNFLHKLSESNVCEFHLGGFVERAGCLLDTHSTEVALPVWELFRDALKMIGFKPTLIEWDNELPAFGTLLQETLKAKALIEFACR